VNNYASVPSLHFGWVFLSGIAVFRQSNAIASKVLGVFMPIAMLFSIVATGNHFILDAVAGGIVALIGLWGSTTLRTLVVNGGPPHGGFRALANQML
jgi:membrane-associated phospholipid phosphatase